MLLYLESNVDDIILFNDIPYGANYGIIPGIVIFPFNIVYLFNIPKANVPVS